MKTHYTLHEDKHNSWLEVSFKELIDYKLVGVISRHSYMSVERRNAYLEENEDAPLFYDTVYGDRNNDFSFTTVQNGEWIKKLPVFNEQWVK